MQRAWGKHEVKKSVISSASWWVVCVHGRLNYFHSNVLKLGPGGGVLPYMGHIGMCRCEGYGFQAVYSSIGYINQSVWV